MELKSIGKYTIVGKIGQGAMGEVYKALDPVLNRHVAIKTMTAAIGHDPELRQRFLREAQSAARLAHPNIVTLYDFGEDQGRVYMAMELLQGSDLKDLIKQGNLPLIAKLDLMEQVCDALAVAHAENVVHRDLKPANIHVQPNNQVKIVDFGLARLGSSEMTKTGMVMGTPHYMSPEQVRGEKADVRSDVFSLGAVFYELLASHKPFDADSLHAVFFQVLEHEPPPVRHWDAQLPEVMVPFLAKALAKDPAQRYASAGEMREALRVVRRAVMGEVEEHDALAVLSGSASTLPPSANWSARVQGTAALAPESRPARRVQSGTLPGTAATAAGAEPGPRSRMPLMVAAGVGVVLLAGGGVVLWQRTRPAPAPSPPSTAGVELMTRELIMTKLDLARTKLEVKDYEAAASEARNVLELQPGNTEALAIKKQVEDVLGQLDAAASEARAAVQKGELEKASRALAQVLAIDPQHPVAAELSKRLDNSFRGQVDEARQAMKRSQAAADGAHASTQHSFSHALEAAQDAEALFAKGEFTMATQKFLNARDDFERARRAAVEKKAPPSSAPLASASGRPLPVPTPHGGGATPLPGASPGPVPASAAPVASGVDEKPAVLAVIADYARAIEQKDLGLYRRVWPTLSSGEEKKLKAAFGAVQDHKVVIRIESVQVDASGTHATVRMGRNDTVKGKPIGTRSQTVSLVKQGGTWTISAIGQ